VWVRACVCVCVMCWLATKPTWFSLWRWRGWPSRHHHGNLHKLLERKEQEQPLQQLKLSHSTHYHTPTWQVVTTIRKVVHTYISWTQGPFLLVSTAIWLLLFTVPTPACSCCLCENVGTGRTFKAARTTPTLPIYVHSGQPDRWTVSSFVPKGIFHWTSTMATADIVNCSCSTHNYQPLVTPVAACWWWIQW